jgi:hypothetical protein
VSAEDAVEELWLCAGRRYNKGKKYWAWLLAADFDPADSVHAQEKWYELSGQTFVTGSVYAAKIHRHVDEEGKPS